MEVFSNMQAAGVKPDDITFSTLVSTAVKSCLRQAVRRAYRIADGVSHAFGKTYDICLSRATLCRGFVSWWI